MAIRSAAARLRAALVRGREPVAAERDELIHTRRILDAIEEYVYVGEILPGDGYRVLFQGPCRARFLALDPEAARSAVWADYVHPDDREVFAAIHDQAVATGSLDGQYRIIGADGVTRWVRDRGRIRREGGRTFLDGSVLDVTMVHTVQEELLATNAALEAARAEADRLGRIDPLTGVSNRRVLPELLDRRLAGGDQALGVLLLDIDRFKRINDGLGHGAGDVVLVEVARRIRATIREQDAVARVGGEEFLVLLDGMSDAGALRALGERIRAAIGGAAIWAQDASVVVTASVGCALSGMEHRSGGSLLAAADRALYAAKRAGRDRVVLAGDPGADRAEDGDGPELALALALAATADARRPGAGAHAEAVGALAAALAARIGAEPAVAWRCRLAGLLHDVGKVTLPDDAGAELARTHPEAGAALLERVPELEPLAPIVRQHHERLDGSGYPAALTGEAIGIEARIVAVAAVFTAMTSGPEAVATEAALDALAGASGTRFDAAVIAALQDVAGPRRAPGAVPQSAARVRT
jgi:diguanylate cyclase (GGDEF)-like protein/putative nucleotidyltransferase with HDIG domain